MGLSQIPLHLLSNYDDVLSGALILGLIGHAVNTFPTPANPYGAWLLGVVQFAVGQRITARNTMNGKQSDVVVRQEGH